MNLILDTFFPKRCVGCGQFDTYFCPSCMANIKQTELVCPKCERPAVGGQAHPICRRKFNLNGLWSLGIYQDPLRSAIKKLKYKWVQELAGILVDITLEYWVRYQPFILEEIKKSRGKDWVVVPVPLHWFRQNNRGFNQSSLIGKQLAEKLGLKYLEVLKRVKYTSPQVKLKGWDRRQNIKHAFEIAVDGRLKAISVLLVDDVWTTGATLKECCFVLKRAGAKQVWALTLAR